MKLKRHSPVWWEVRSDNRWFRFETMRAMVPVRQVRNPFAGQRSWKLVLGALSLSWQP